MADFQSWKQDATPHFAEARVCFDRALVARYEQAARKLEEATRGTEVAMLEGPDQAIAREVDDLEAELEEKTRTLRFESIGARAWKELMADHPPSDDDRDKQAGYNIETFVPAALSKSCVDPELTVEDAKWITETMPDGVIGEIVKACFDANLEGGNPKKAAATVAVARSRSKSTQR